MLPPDQACFYLITPPVSGTVIHRLDRLPQNREFQDNKLQLSSKGKFTASGLLLLTPRDHLKLLRLRLTLQI